jgi:hypothetical protein
LFVSARHLDGLLVDVSDSFAAAAAAAAVVVV